MNLQERVALERFLDQLVQVHGLHKIPEADALIREAFDRQPDAPYLLVQRTLLLEQALNRSKARISELEQGQRAYEGSFLATGASGAISAAKAAPAPEQIVGAPAASPISPTGSAGSSFLGQAAATAAGVAGGAFLFEGVESLLGHHSAALPGQAGVGALAPEDVTINNFYESDNEAQERGHDGFDSPTDDDVDFGDNDSFS